MSHEHERVHHQLYYSLFKLYVNAVRKIIFKENTFNSLGDRSFTGAHHFSMSNSTINQFIGDQYNYTGDVSF